MPSAYGKVSNKVASSEVQIMRSRVIAAVTALVIFSAAGVLAQDQTPPQQDASDPQAPAQAPSKQAPGDPGLRRMIRVGGNVAQANIVHQVAPVYPPLAKTAHITGTVLLRCIVSKDGTVVDLTYISGPPLLMKAAIDAVRQWKYKPTLLNGVPVQVDTTVSVVFTLDGTNAGEASQHGATIPPDNAAPPPAAETGNTAATKSASPPVHGTSEVDLIPSVRPHAKEVNEFYEQGRAEIKQQNYANAVESFTSALKLDPEAPDVWRELGRAQMYLQNYADAETAFRKYLALAPDNRFAYLNMAWALFAERKYAEEADLLQKRIADGPEDGEANARLGAAYLALHQPEEALPVLQKAVSIVPDFEYPQFNLGHAYLQLHQEDRAAKEFERAIQISDTSNTRNSAAYELAQANTHLEIAEAWSQQSIQSLELELSQAKIPLQPAAMRRVAFLAAYWDTLGWIKFQQGKFDLAQKYIRASAELADDSTILMHLGKIYEAQGRKDEALEAYAEALTNIPTTREMDNDEKEARARLVALLGSDALVDERVKQARAKLAQRRSISIPNSAGVEGVAQYAIIVGPASKVIDVEPLSSDEALSAMKGSLTTMVMPQSIPDDTTKKLPRTGTLSCPRAEQPCTFTFGTAASASRIIAAE